MRLPIAFAAPLVAGALLATGCGGSSATTIATASTATTTAPSKRFGAVPVSTTPGFYVGGLDQSHSGTPQERRIVFSVGRDGVIRDIRWGGRPVRVEGAVTGGRFSVKFAGYGTLEGRWTHPELVTGTLTLAPSGVKAKRYPWAARWHSATSPYED